MLERIVVYAVSRYVGGPAKSWIWVSLALVGVRAIRSRLGPTKVVELRATQPGDRIVIEHLDITHAEQIKASKPRRKRKALLWAARSASRRASRLSRAARSV